MFSLFRDAGGRLAATFNGFSFNDPDEDDDDYAEITDVTWQTSYDSVTDPLDGKDGMEAYNALKVARIFAVRGTLHATSQARLNDRFEEMAVALDPALSSLNNPTTFGFLPFDFSVVTENLDDYQDGLIPSRYYCRALKPLEPPDSRLVGDSQDFDFSMLCVDPRRYLQAQDNIVGAGTADNSKADYISYPTISIAMTGAGSATYQLANTTLGRTLRLDLSGRINADTVVVDMFQQRVTINGTENNGIVGSTSQWWYMKPGDNVLTVTNGTNATTTTSWRSAFVL
jgi:hypothetical protein